MPLGGVIAPQAVLPTSLLPQPSPMPVTNSNILENLSNALKQAQSLYASKETASKEQNSANIAQASCREQSINNDNPSSSSRPECLPTGQAQQNWLNETMPIILSLDPTSSSNDPTPPPIDPTLNDGRYSPTYTSKSFDDLHQLIGKHCPPNESDDEDKPSQGIESMGPATYAAIRMQDEETKLSKQGSMQKTFLCGTTVNKIESNNKELGLQANKDPSDSRTFVHPSDEYSFFAHLSAIEASKHSAYMPIVSGSERSSSEFGTDSDLASEEGCLSADSLLQRKKRKLNSNEGTSQRGKTAKLQNDN